MHGIVAYKSTFLWTNVREKNHQFLPSIKKDAHKKIRSSFLAHGAEENSTVMSAEPTLACEYMHVTECLFQSSNTKCKIVRSSKIVFVK